MAWKVERRASTILYNYLMTLPKGIKFFVPANVCPIVLATFLKAQVSYELIDIDCDSLCISLKDVEKNLKANTPQGLLFVRTFGFCADVSDWFRHIKAQNPLLHIVDDRCLCRPSFEENTFYDCVDITLFSTGYAKFVEFGLGGYAWLSPEIASSYKELPLPFQSGDHEQLVSDFNQAISLRETYNYKDSAWLNNGGLDESTESYFSRITQQYEVSKLQKDKINNIYKRLIPEHLWLGERFNDWRFSIFVKDKNLLIQQIFNAGYFASSHYASMAGIFSEQRAKVTSSVHGHVVNLFNDHRVTEDAATEIAQIVLEYERKHG